MNFVAGDRLSRWYSQDPITLNELRRSHRSLLIVRSIFLLLAIKKVLHLGYKSWRLENGIRDVLISTFTFFIIILWMRTHMRRSFHYILREKVLQNDA